MPVRTRTVLPTMAGLTHRIATSTLSAETRTEIIQILSGIDLDDDDFQDRLNEVEDAIIEAEENQTVNDDASEAAPGTPPFDGSPASRPADAQAQRNRRAHPVPG